MGGPPWGAAIRVAFSHPYRQAGRLGAARHRPLEYPPRPGSTLAGPPRGRRYGRHSAPRIARWAGLGRPGAWPWNTPLVQGVPWPVPRGDADTGGIQPPVSPGGPAWGGPALGPGIHPLVQGVPWPVPRGDGDARGGAPARTSPSGPAWGGPALGPKYSLCSRRNWQASRQEARCGVEPYSASDLKPERWRCPAGRRAGTQCPARVSVKSHSGPPFGDFSWARRKSYPAAGPGPGGLCAPRKT